MGGEDLGKSVHDRGKSAVPPDPPISSSLDAVLAEILKSSRWLFRRRSRKRLKQFPSRKPTKAQRRSRKRLKQCEGRDRRRHGGGDRQKSGRPEERERTGGFIFPKSSKIKGCEAAMNGGWDFSHKSREGEFREIQRIAREIE